MADCFNFFDDSAARLPRSPPRNEAEDSQAPRSPGLELTLGPSSFTGTPPPFPPQEHDAARAPPAFACLQQQQSSGNFASPLLAASHTPQAPSLHSDGSRLSRSQHDISSGLSRQGSAASFPCDKEHPHTSVGNSADDLPRAAKSLLSVGNPGFLSRDQIWQTLQTSDTTAASAWPANDSAPMWSRRAMSLHTAFPMDSVKDLEIRRTSSNGLPMNPLSQTPSTTVRTAKPSPKQRIISFLQPPSEELEDLHNRKKLQAQRRLAARRRCRALTGEKQHKKRRRTETVHATNMRSKSPDNGVSCSGGLTGEDDSAPESACICPDEWRFGQPDDATKGTGELQHNSKIEIQMTSTEDAECASNNLWSNGAVPNASILSHGYYPNSVNFPPNQNDPGISGNNVSVEHYHAGLRRNCFSTTSLPFSGTDQESWKLQMANCDSRSAGLETEERRAFCRRNANLLDVVSSLSDSAKETVGMVRTMSYSLSSAPAGCPPLQSHFMQFVPSSMGIAAAVDGMKMDAPFTCPAKDVETSLQENGLSLGSLPSMRVGYPNAIHTGLGLLPLSSGSFLSRTVSAVEDSEGRRGGSALYKTFSNPRILHEEPQNVRGHLDIQVSQPASQLSSTGADIGKSLLQKRQHSRPLGARLMSQNSCVVDQSFSSSRPHKSVVQLSLDPKSERLCKPTLKQEEWVKQEEVSSESQLASEHSMDAVNARLAGSEKPKSGPAVDLVWVTTTGNGPNGKTINGFMYVAHGQRVRLVCCCHGKHMSPAEFVEHSGSDDLSNPERNIIVSRFPHSNHQAATTPV